MGEFVMPEAVAVGVWIAIGFYALAGAFVWLWLTLAGFSRFDANAGQAPFYVKALWAPGCLALWPVLLKRAFGAGPPEDRP